MSPLPFYSSVSNDPHRSNISRKITGISSPLTSLSTREEVYLSLGLPCPPQRLLGLHEGQTLAALRLSSADFTVSPSQPITPGQGNSCMFYALHDQVTYQPGLTKVSMTASHLRQKLVQAAYNSIKSGKLTWPCSETSENWRDRMNQEGTMGDEVILQAASNLFNKDIVILPVFHEAAHNQDLGITLICPNSPHPPDSSAIYLLYYSESCFTTPHYQSIRPANTINVISDYVKSRRKIDDEDDFISLFDSLPNPPTKCLPRPCSSCSSCSMSSSSSNSFPSSHSSSMKLASLHSSSLPSWYVAGTKVKSVGRETRI